jgi:hypothetical protein
MQFLFFAFSGEIVYNVWHYICHLICEKYRQFTISVLNREKNSPDSCPSCLLHFFFGSPI